MRIALALLVLPAFLSAAHAADVKGTTRIDAVTVFPSGAEITRVGKVKLEGGDHVILFTDLPAQELTLLGRQDEPQPDGEETLRRRGTFEPPER